MFDATVRRLIEAGDSESLVNYEGLGESARLSVPTNEHYLPLLYALALREKGESVRFFTETVSWGSLSMRSLAISRTQPK
jgi:4,5-DOPA dioxygenase extradiol